MFICHSLLSCLHRLRYDFPLENYLLDSVGLFTLLTFVVYVMLTIVFVMPSTLKCPFVVYYQSERCDHNYGRLAAAMEEERMNLLV